jgi:hypothetical protein
MRSGKHTNTEEPIMNPFIAHPRQQGIGYVEHCHFAMSIACRLFTTTVAFAVHALVPFIGIKPRLDLESTAAYLAEQNRWIEGSRSRVQPDTGSRLGAMIIVKGGMPMRLGH